MKLHLRFDESNATHTKFTVFMNGASCGQLCMRSTEALEFHNLATQGQALTCIDEVISSGKFYEGELL